MKQKAIVITISNNKGGVGKTMTAQNLGAALATKGKKVCLIDADSQHNLTNRFENENRKNELRNREYAGLTIEDYFLDATLPIRPLEIKKNLYLIPSTIKLAFVANTFYSLKKNDNAGDKMKVFCSYLQEAFDFIIIDSEPGMGAMMVNAVRAADLIIIPINCQDAMAGAVEGVFGMMEANSIKTPYFFVQTMHESRLKSSRDIRSQLLADATESTFRTFIKKNEYLNIASSGGQDIFEYAPKSGGAEDYKDLASEVISIGKKLLNNN